MAVVKDGIKKSEHYFDTITHYTVMKIPGYAIAVGVSNNKMTMSYVILISWLVKKLCLTSNVLSSMYIKLEYRHDCRNLSHCQLWCHVINNH